MRMRIIKVSEEIDEIVNGYTDFDKLSPLEQVEYTEVENKLFYMERLKRKEERNKRKGFFKNRIA